MQSNQQQIIGLIHQMRTEQVSQAEEKLMSLVGDPQFMDSIFNIIRNQTLDGWVKTIASTFLNRVICQKLEQLGYKNMFSAISNIMSSYQIASTDKRCFQRSLISLIDYIKQPEEADQWRNFILKYIKDPQLFDTGLLLIACTAVAQIDITYLCIIVEQTFELTIKSFSTVSVQNALIANQLVKNWIVVLDKLKMIKDDEVVDQTLDKICKSKSLAKIILAIYDLNSPGQIWLCVNPQLYELNMLKHQSAQLHRRVAEYAYKNKIPENACPCLQIIAQSYNTIKNTVAVVGSNLKIIENIQCQDFVVSLISLLIIYIKRVHNQTVEEMNILTHIVCFPFLGTRDQELVYFQDSPVQFNSLAEDICDKQTFGILKTQAAKLLEAISDCSRDSMQDSILFCVQCIKINMKYVASTFSQSEVRILSTQTALQILTIYSFSIQQFPAQLQALKIIMCDKRMMELPPLELSKVFLFLAYNYGQIFKNPLDGNLWVQFALNYKMHPTTRYMALDFISNISDQFFTEGFFNEFTKLIVQCQERQSGQVWSIILKIFESQKDKISQQLCLNLVNTVFVRIQREITLVQSKNKENTLDIINSLHVLRRIIEETEYIQSKQTLKQKIFNITIMFNRAIELGIQDQIIKVLIQYIKIDGQHVRGQIYGLLPDILNQFKREEYHEKSYFILLNQIVVKSKFQSIKPIITSLLSGLMFHLFDMSQNAKKQKMKISIANILTLLQNLLCIHGYEMSGKQEDILCSIGSMCVRLFPAKEDEKVFSKSLLAKAMNLMFLCHLYSRTQNTIQYLIRFARDNIFHKYDAYLLIKLLTKAVFSEDNINIVIEYLSLMIDVVNQEQKNQKKGLGYKTAKGKMKIKRDEDLNKLLQKITTPFLDFELKKVDSKYPLKKEVTDCISRMKSNNLETYKLIIMNMNEQQKVKLTQILNQVTQIQGKNRIIRKVIGVRSKQEGHKQENSDVQQNDEQSDENSFKRERVLLKKKDHKRRNNQPISIE